MALTVPRSPLRPLWFALACLGLGIGIVGVLVPGLPTTPFLILAAAAAARGSTRLHDWLVRHRILGPLMADWRANRAVSRRAKGMATATMAVSAGVLFLVAPSTWLAAVATAVMVVVGSWLWMRPEPGGR